MNGFGEHGHEEDAFGPSKGGIVSSFDAFRKYSWRYEKTLRFGLDCRAIGGTQLPDSSNNATNELMRHQQHLKIVPKLTCTYSQNQEDIPRSRPQLLRVDRHAYPHMHLPLLVRDNALVRRDDLTILPSRERCLS
jgi:hypothetical protein